MQDGDVLNLQGQVEIDDDNAPAPENIPSDGSNADADDVFSGWGHDGVCQRRQSSGLNNEALVFNFGGYRTYIDFLIWLGL